MKYPAYPKYKPSGVEWLGNVPAHWDVLALKRIVSTPVTDGPHETPEILDEGIPFVSAEAIKNEKIDFSKIRGFISVEDHKRYSLKYKPHRNDIYVIKSGATTGNVAMVETNDEFNIWSPLAAIRPNVKIAFSRFIFHFLRSKEFLTSIQLGWSFGTQQNIGMNVIENLPLSLPSVTEQQAIADFLDCETGRIDNLIDKKARLIEMLKEKRTALISHTVTKGLNSKVKMKPSGVEWLDDVPEHWEVKKIKYVTNQIIDGTHITPTYVNDGIPFLRVTDIQRNIIDLESVKFIPEEEHIELKRRCQPEPQDVLLSKNGTIGITKVIDWDWEFSIFVSLCLIKLKKQNVNSYFFSYQFGSHAITQQIVEGTKQTSVINLHLDKIKELLVILPLLAEQQAIVDYLDQETDKIDTLITKVETAIDKLKEYRTAIISAAVKGKIDVSTRFNKRGREVA